MSDIILLHKKFERMTELLSIIEEDNPRGADFTRLLGARGEGLAARYLVDNGYRLVVSNFKVPVGRNSRGLQITGEIDIIALDGETLAFVEVKSRRSVEFTHLTANINLRKQRQITRTARVYRRLFRLFDMPQRFDVVTVLMPKHAEPEINLNKGFWTENSFKKKTWDRESWSELV